jgi:hypothetical protein
VAIVDFDVHHGNGTQAIFEREPRVDYFSTHESGLFPHTGGVYERGVGNVMNVLLPPGSGSQRFRNVWADQVLPAVDAFTPQLLMVSAGFDAHMRDPMADLMLETEDFGWITRELRLLAERHADGRIVSTLEGGYDLEALRECSVAHVAELLSRAAKHRRHEPARTHPAVFIAPCRWLRQANRPFPPRPIPRAPRLPPVAPAAGHRPEPAGHGRRQADQLGFVPGWRRVAEFLRPADHRCLAQGSRPAAHDHRGRPAAGHHHRAEYDGNVALRRGDQFVGTDKLSFDTETGNYIADGMSATRTPRSGWSPSGRGQPGKRHPQDHRHQVPAGVPRGGNGDAESVDLNVRSARCTLHLHHLRPVAAGWELSAPQIEVDNDEGFGTARNAVLRIGKCRSVGRTSSSRSTTAARPACCSRAGHVRPQRLRLRQPIYLNLAPNYDDTLTAPHEPRGLMLDNEFRYLYNGGRGEMLTASYMPNDRLRDRTAAGCLQAATTSTALGPRQPGLGQRRALCRRFRQPPGGRDRLQPAEHRRPVRRGRELDGRHHGRPLAADRLHSDRAAAVQPPAAPVLQLGQPSGRWLETGIYAEAVRFTHDDINFKYPTTYERTGSVLCQTRRCAAGRQALRVVPLSGPRGM